MEKTDILHVVDGSGFIFRAFYALPPMTRSDGVPVGAVLGFCNMLIKLLVDIDAHRIVVVFDSGRETFRNEIYPAYKANRGDTPEDLIPQFDLIRQACDAFAIPRLELPGFEADDIIATIATKAAQENMAVRIVSSDKDLMQLVAGDVDMMDPMKNLHIGREEVIAKFGVPPEKVIDVQALCGDASDNVPGVPGIGIKTAALLINQFGTLEALLDRTDEVPQVKRRALLETHQEQARLSKRLVTLHTAVPLAIDLGALERTALPTGPLFAFFQQQNFKRLMTWIKTIDESNVMMGGALHPASAKEQAQLSRDTPEQTPEAGAVTPDTTPFSIAPHTRIDTTVLLDAWVAKIMKQGSVAVTTLVDTIDKSPSLIGIGLCLVTDASGDTFGDASPGKAGQFPDSRYSTAYIPIAQTSVVAPREGGLFAQADEHPQETPFLSAAVVLKTLGPCLADESILKIGHNIKNDMHVFQQAGAELRTVDDVMFMSYTLIGHNITNDMHAFQQAGIKLSTVDDVMVMSYILDGTRHTHDLDQLAQTHLAHQTIGYKSLLLKDKQVIAFSGLAPEAAGSCAAEMAHIIQKLHQLFTTRLVTEGLNSIYQGIDRPLIQTLQEMEAAGILLDCLVLKKLSATFDGQLMGLEKTIQAAAGQNFNLASPKQLGEVLFDVLKLPGGKKGKSGTYTTGASVLEKLSEEGHELADQILDWRRLAKLKSTYTDALPLQVNPRTGRIHSTFSQTTAITGRLSSFSPNLQNIPIRTTEGRHIREAFIPSPGNVLVSLDYSQIELRLLAHMADIQVLQDAFSQGADIHRLTASEALGIPLDEVTPAQRSMAKTINFGIIYGMSAFGLAKQTSISRGEAADYIKKYFKKYPGILNFMEEIKEEARTHGAVKTLFGRRIIIPDINASKPMLRQLAERQAINAPIQGSAADLIKKAMNLVKKTLESQNIEGCMLLQVHDELIFEVPSGAEDILIACAKKCMENIIKLKVPLVVDAGVGHNWAQAH